MPDIFISKNSKKQKTAKRRATGRVVPRKAFGKTTKKKAPVQKFEKKILTKKHSEDHHPLSSFRFYPAHADFLNKDPEEKVILLLRKHPITNLGWISISFLMIIAPAFITILPFFTAMPVGFQIVSVLCWYLIATAFAFEKFLGWFYHVNIITDERIFDIDFLHLTYREITDADIDQIQDVTVEVGGTIRTVLNFGNVLIQTAAEIPQVEFEAVPEPDKVARILRELRIEEEIEKLEGRIR
jgi:hypothetical protein